jgi:4-amino-4-deoxy-L-arabinose transferase-like glycosyltransferase
MKQPATESGWALWLLAIYLVVGITWHWGSTSLSHDEALTILIGEQALSRQPTALLLQHTGTVLIQPVLVALGNSLAGLNGARFVSLLFGMGLFGGLYVATRWMLSARLAFYASMVLVGSGTVLYLSGLVTYDIVAAFFLVLAMAFAVLARKRNGLPAASLFLAASAVSLFLAVISKYLLAVMVLPVAAWILWHQRGWRPLVFFFFPLVLLLLAYHVYAYLPAQEYLSGSMTGLYREGRLGIDVLFSRFYRWLGLPYVLAFFGLFHHNGAWRRTALTGIILSLPVLLLHLLTGDGRSIDKNVVFPLVFLAPACAVGIDHMGNIFSSHERNSWVHSLFTGMVLVVLWAYGLNQQRWLEGQFPDLTPVVAHLESNGFNGMRVFMDTDYGDPDIIYRYLLRERFPRASFASSSHTPPGERTAKAEELRPDFIILDQYYAAEPLGTKECRYLPLGYAGAATFNLRLSWGTQTVSIYRRIQP